MSYTVNSLKQIRQLWDLNWAKMQETKGSPEWKHYVRKERKITRKEIRIQKELDKYIIDPCPLTRSQSNRIYICENCTGWYGTKEGNKKHKLDYYQTPEGIGQKCIMRDIMIKGAVYTRQLRKRRSDYKGPTEGKREA